MFCYFIQYKTSCFLPAGASHGDDLGYIFSITGTNTEESSLNSPEMKVLQKMVKLWTNFAKYGLVIINNESIFTKI